MTPPDVMTYAQALDHFSPSAVRNRVSSGRWQRPARGVYVTHNGPLTPEQRDDVARLACVPGSVLGGLSALAYDAMTGFSPERPTVVQPMGAVPPSYDDVTVHWSTYLDERDVHPLRRPARTRPARSLVDAASWASSDLRARAIVIAGVQQGVCTTRMLREALTRRGRCRRRALIVESILDAHGGIQSLPELSFARICARFGLPKPSRQAVVRGPDGRYYLDVEWKEFRTAVEIHGIPHLRILDWEADLERSNEIVITGRRLLQFSSYATRHQQDRVGRQTLRMLVSGGFRPKESF